MKIAILFDEENQQEEVTLLKKWELDYDLGFIGYGIKSKKSDFTDIDIKDYSIFVILIGESSRFLSAQFISDVKLIINSPKSILCFNINGFIGLSEEECPRILWDCGAIHMSFDKENVSYSLSAIKSDARETNKSGSFHFRKEARPYDME